ncbi:hypothetical protein [Marinicrinis lubricantis]|uniref:Uncharacterized protein n=1 Tax=Marinicrinis lubricantis TaxID=2086470 RepID=A0ABW1IQ83_9BACL
MHRRTTGVIFICIAAFLYGIRYLAAAIWGSGVLSWNHGMFQSMLEYVGDGPVMFSTIALIIGLIYLILGEIESFIPLGTKIKKKLKKDVQQMKDNWNEFDTKG